MRRSYNIGAGVAQALNMPVQPANVAELRAQPQAFRGKYDQPPDLWAAQGYDALKILVLAMEEGGMAHPDSVKLGLLNIKYEGAAGRSQFNEMGDVTRYPTVFVFKSGLPMPYDAFKQEGGKLRVPPITISKS